MKLIIISTLFLTLSLSGALAQEGQRDVKVISTNLEKLEIVRMSTGTDMLDGLNQAIEKKGIKNAIILTGIGSVSSYHFHVVSDKNLPPAEEFPKASVAMDLTTVDGYIINGRVHAHITLSDENSMVGGHLEPGTIALTFFIITLGILPDDIDIEDFDNYKFY